MCLDPKDIRMVIINEKYKGMMLGEITFKLACTSIISKVDVKMVSGPST